MFNGLRTVIEKIRNSKIGNFININKKALLLMTAILFGISYLSIPLCSFRVGLFFITWLFTIALLFLILVYFLFIQTPTIDLIILSFILFCFSALFSSSLNAFKSFTATPFLLSTITGVFYLYFKLERKNINIFIFSFYCSTLVFSLIYFVTFRKELLSLNFGRLGGKFGDINDIAIFICVGATIAINYIFNSKKILFKILNILAFAFIFFIGASTGSKIFYFGIITVLVCSLFFYFGKKKWYLAVSLSISIIILAIMVLLLPALSEIKNRLLNFLKTLLGIPTGTAGDVDYGTVFRYDMFNSAMHLWLRKPLFGFGVFGYSIQSGINIGWSHNHFSEILCNYGAIGFLLFHFPFAISVGRFSSFKGKNTMCARLLEVFFIVCMLSVSLDTEKTYAYLVPLVFAELSNGKAFSRFVKRDNYFYEATI